jgi:effector-binding domain-containing protein
MMQRYDVQVSTVLPVPLVAVRCRVSQRELSRVVPEACGAVWNAVRAQNLPAGRHVAVYLDGSISLEVGVECAGPFAAQGDFVTAHTPGGLTASVTHLGPYDTLGAAHDAVRQWCEEHDYRLTGPSWEVYGHWQDAWNADPGQIRTDIFYQVAPPSRLS